MSGDHNMNQGDPGWRKRQIALDKKAENARELGLDYEPDKTIIEMAREAGFVEDVPECAASVWVQDTEITEIIERFAALVRADEAEKHKWDIHSCGPTCQRYACVSMREAVEAEREACAKVCDDLTAPERMSLDNESLYECATFDCAAAIRAKGQA